MRSSTTTFSKKASVPGISTVPAKASRKANVTPSNALNGPATSTKSKENSFMSFYEKQTGGVRTLGRNSFAGPQKLTSSKSVRKKVANESISVAIENVDGSIEFSGPEQSYQFEVQKKVTSTG